MREACLLALRRLRTLKWMGQPPPSGSSESIPPIPPALRRARSGRQPPSTSLSSQLPPSPSAPGRRRWLAVPIAVAVYLFLALFTLIQPIKVASLSLVVPIPGLASARLFGLPDRPYTVAIVGLDRRPTETGPSRTDSILLVRVDEQHNRAGILSIPRDAMMEIPLVGGTVTDDRINTAFVYNWSSNNASAAPNALSTTIEHNLGIKVDYYIVFDQRGAEKIIDSAGGVTVNVKDAFGQDNYSDDDVHVVPQYFPAGTQHLNGYQAVAYGRIREGSSDFDRIRRQQQVAEGLVSGLSSPLSLPKLPGLLSAYRGAVQTNLSTRQSAGLFTMLKKIGTDRMVTRSLGDAAVSCNYCKAAILLLNPDKTAQLIDEAFNSNSAGQNAAQLLVRAGVTP
jgi:polyisoprenyl-teichoic acid--peptidoglycan teichoic acid transferase